MVKKVKPCYWIKNHYLKRNAVAAGRLFMKSIKIKGMSCQHCVMAASKALSALDGIKNVQVDLKTGTATYEEVRPVDAKVVATAIKKAGFDVVE
jgi:copper chaperone